MHYLPHKTIADVMLETARGLVAEHGEMGGPAIIIKCSSGDEHIMLPCGGFEVSMFPSVWEMINQKIPNVAAIIVAHELASEITVTAFDKMYGRWCMITGYHKDAEGKVQFDDTRMVDGEPKDGIPAPWSETESFVPAGATVN